MRTSLSCCTFLVFAISPFALAQGHPGRGTPSFGSTGPTPFPSTEINAGAQSPIYVAGKVVLDDGTELTEPATIQTICRGQRRTETYSDTHGGFSFQLGDANASTAAAVSDASSSNFGTAGIAQPPRDCQLQAVLAGFSSQAVELANRGVVLNSIDVGRVSLHRLEHVEGTSISVTNALAPSAAKKALEKGREQEKKGKWEDARKAFEKAVQIYPRYAAAWNELGRLQLRDHDGPSARHSFEQSLAADPRYVNPYDGLAELGMLAHDWQSVIDVTSKLFALDPISFPEAYYYNAVGYYSLGNLDAAEKSALQGVRVDEAHQIPRLQYVLGLIHMRRQDYAAASEHMQLYLRFAAQPAEADQARKSLAEIEKLSASTKPLLADPPK
jgi:tetratricopeptide (TPR) repeat protein